MAGTPEERPEGKHPGGRPSKYHRSYAGIAYQLCRLHGYTDEKLAEVMGVGIATLKRWKDRHEEFRTQVRAGKDEFDGEQVESALLKRAKGFVRKKVVKRTSARMARDGKPAGRGRITTTEVMEEVPASVDAAKFWLQRRNPSRWPAKPEDGLGEEDGGVVAGVLIAPAQEDYKEWLKSHGIDPESSLPGGPTPADNGNS